MALMSRSGRRLSTATAVALVLGAALVYGQQIGWAGGAAMAGTRPGGRPLPISTAVSFTAAATTPAAGASKSGSGWNTDYPGADSNFSDPARRAHACACQIRHEPAAPTTSWIADGPAVVPLSVALHGGHRHGRVLASRTPEAARYLHEGRIPLGRRLGGSNAWSNLWMSQASQTAVAGGVPGLRHSANARDHAHAL